MRRQGDLGPEDVFGLDRSVAGGCWGVLFAQPFMLSKLIGHGSSVEEPWRAEEQNGAHSGRAMLKSPPQAQVRAAPDPGPGFMNGRQAGGLVGGDGERGGLA